MLFRHSCILLKQSLPVEGGQTGKISPKSRRQHQQSQVVRSSLSQTVLFAIKKNEQLGFVGVACGIWGRSSQYALLLLDGIASRKCMIGENRYKLASYKTCRIIHFTLNTPHRLSCKLIRGDNWT